MRIHPSRLFALFLPFISLLPTASAEDGILYTNSVSYCAEAKAVIVEAFDIAYHQSNQSLTFTFSLASVESNLNVAANLYVNAYGMQIINETLNLCDYLQGVICPLPQVNFTGFGTYPIPSQYTKDIPGLAFTVPNLEAYARVQLLREETGEVAACLQATLSNGKTTKHKAVAIATGVFTLVALLVGLFHSTINSPSPAQYRWFDILYLYQTAVATGLLHLNYPLVFSNFVQNFAWSFALFYSRNVEDSINSMRSKTGGTLDGTAYSAVQYINRKLSPYNFGSNLVVDLNTITTPSQFNSLIATSPGPDYNTLYSRATIPSALYTNDTESIETGIPVYVNTIGIASANAFTTIFFFFLAFIGIAVAFHVLLFIVVFIVDKTSGDRRGMWATRLRRSFWDFSVGNALRVCLIWFLPIWIFAFYQFKIGDSGLAIAFAVLGILFTLVPLAAAFVLSMLRSRRPSSTAPTISPLYTSYNWFHSVGMIYRPYRQRFHFFWFAPLVLAMIARAGFIAFGPANAWAQVIGNLVVELIVLVALIACRPHKDRKGDWLAPFLSLCRLIAFGLLIAFIPSLEIGAIIRTVIGIVEIAVIGIPTVLLFFGLIWNAGYGYLWRRHTHRIEDGLEVERFVASDDSSAQAAMTQTDANNFVSGPGALSSRHDDSRPSLGRRTSVMEPVDNTYEPGSTSHWQDPSPVSSRGHGAMDPASSAGMYEDAAAGLHDSSSDYASRRMSGMNMHHAPPSRRSTGYDMSQAPQEGYQTSSQGHGGRDQYYGKY